MQEAALVKYGDKVLSYCVGRTPKPGELLKVRFDVDRVWNFCQLNKPIDPDLLHFFHVHPPGNLLYTAIDVKYLKNLNKIFGFPVLFSIVCFKSDEVYDENYNIATYRYEKHGGEKEATMKVTRAYGLNPKDVLGLRVLSQAMVIEEGAYAEDTYTRDALRKLDKEY